MGCSLDIRTFIASHCRYRSCISTRSRIQFRCIAANRALSFPVPTIDMSGAKKLLPLLDRVLVERARAGAQKSAGGILLPESASKVRWSRGSWVSRRPSRILELERRSLVAGRPSVDQLMIVRSPGHGLRRQSTSRPRYLRLSSLYSHRIIVCTIDTTDQRGIGRGRGSRAEVSDGGANSGRCQGRGQSAAARVWWCAG